MMEELRAHFRPEFLNRVDDIVIFHSLKEAQLKNIVDIQLKRFEKLLSERKIDLKLTDKAKALLAKHGYDPVYGARPLKRAIQKDLQDPLSLKILEGTFREGDTIEADAGEVGAMVFRKK